MAINCIANVFILIPCYFTHSNVIKEIKYIYLYIIVCTFRSIHLRGHR